MSEPQVNSNGRAHEPWLEVVDSQSSILLIAPHGGRAEQRTRAMLNPKVNDLHTADITRGLADRLGASALINADMDRNRLDCNRLSQIIERAPWLLEMIAERVARIVERHGRVTVLLIHGWNIIEPRIDLGLGLKHFGNELRPTGAACVSASDAFINGPLGHLAERLGNHGIKPTYGMRYPGGGAQNLLQAFTSRHRQSEVAALRQLSEIAMTGAVDAAQLELSVALRMPGELRERCADTIGAVFSGNGVAAHSARSPIMVNRTPRPFALKREIGAAATVAAPGRIGIELYDPATRIGAMASFDVGGAGMGARIMVLFEGRRVGLFTAEGRPARTSNTVAHGPLSMTREGKSVVLKFKGPAVIVPDATAYLSIERALASGRLDGAMEVNVRVEIADSDFDFDSDRMLTTTSADPGVPSASAAFGRFAGSINIEGVERTVAGFARAGASFTGLGPQKFAARRMLWACFEDSGGPVAIEARSLQSEDMTPIQSAELLDRDNWSSAELEDLTIHTPTVEEPPTRVCATLKRTDGTKIALNGRVECFIPLSRPGPDQSRIYTSLGFASFTSGERRGAGMFEYSRRAQSVMTASDEGEDSDSD